MDTGGSVEELLEATVDLTQLRPPDKSSPTLHSLQAVRYLAGPPISAWTT